MRGGVITKAWVFRPGEFEDDDTSVYLIGEAGELNSMWDWAGHRMHTLDSDACGELRFSTSRGVAAEASRPQADGDGEPIASDARGDFGQGSLLDGD